MGQEKSLSRSSGRITCEIPLKLPSLNEYIGACRANRMYASAMKRKMEEEIGVYIADLPRFNSVRIHFTWTEANKRRDLDNVAFGKKFILDALVKAGKLKDDNRRCVTGFTDSFEYGNEAKVTLEIEEV